MSEKERQTYQGQEEKARENLHKISEEDSLRKSELFNQYKEKPVKEIKQILRQRTQSNNNININNIDLRPNNLIRSVSENRKYSLQFNPHNQLTNNINQ